ncbi:hypothetical protein WA026_004613 [Henosepilachna vigintioctopunctata]|uniref:SSD domain-containing protein n=1 Tax=Henosepilachna vigintioctopunctata TaxID=420089 RepID=A0AAW1VAJ7_9CUCU
MDSFENVAVEAGVETYRGGECFVALDFYSCSFREHTEYYGFYVYSALVVKGGMCPFGKARGDRGVLWLRGKTQRQLHSLGTILDNHAGKILFVGLLAIATFSVGLKSVSFHTDIELLWAEPYTTQEMLSTHQMIIQTSNDPDINLLQEHSLLEHLDLVQKATQVTVTMYEMTWRLKDFCQLPSIPNIDFQYIEQIFENMMPCSIVTPLDCFWEGSKLLGPDYPVTIPYGIGDKVTWKNLNPDELVKRMKKNHQPHFDYHSLEDYFKRAGITSGYQEKPCLNPVDDDCPNTAPNVNSTHHLDIGAVLTNGCYGFATNYMHWPTELIIGGISKNKTGHVREAKALQTVVQLMGEQEVYEYWLGHYKVHHIGWTQEKASVVLNAWQKKFADEVEKIQRAKSSTVPYSFTTFSTANLNKILKEHSKTDIVKMCIVLAVGVVYGWVVHSGIAALGVVMLAASSAAALGVCSLLGLPMNLLSTHVLPFITVGLALREMFLLLSTQARNLSPPEVLQRVGPTIISSTIISCVTFLAAAILPIPALRVFCLQCAVMIMFQNIALMLIFPSLLALEQRCRRAAVPCFQSEVKNVPPNINNNDPEHGANLLTAEMVCQEKRSLLCWLVNRYLTSVLLQPFMKVMLCFTYAVLIIFCVFNGLKVKFDVRLSTFLPKNTQEYKYLEAQNRFFGFYNFYLVTTELEYPLNQPLLYEYHNSLTQVPHVLKDSNGGLDMKNFWLANFRDYLIDLQDEFDANKIRNSFYNEKWFPNATEKAVLAYKLLAQTGVVEYPVDKSQVFKKRLVKNGIIDPKAFYNYLSAWNCNDQMSYSSSQANFSPKPFQYYSSKVEMDLQVPKSQPLVYTQMPFYLKNLKTSESIVNTLKQIKQISEDFNQRGLNNYPVGLIFAYFNQFLMLYQVLASQLGLTLLAAAFIACLLVQWNKLWCPALSTISCLLLLTFVNINALTGTMGGLHFIIVSRNILLLSTGFLSALGNRERRLRMSLEISSEAIIKGDIGLIICASVLATSQFEFIQYHLFNALLISVGGALTNSLVFFPLLLSLFGPKSELQPVEHTERISTPPPPVPPPTPIRTTTYSKPPRRTTTTKATREPSLTTITEESCNQSIVVEPQVTVEYSSPESSSSGPFTTKVTATANIKVELVANVHRSKCGKCHRSRCNRRRQQCRCCKNDSDSSDSSADPEHCSSS